MSKKFLHIDLETTGLTNEHGVVQIAGIIDIDGEVKEEFNFFARPFEDDIISQEALDVIGYTKEEIGEFDDPIEVKNKFIDLLDKYVNRYDKNDKFTLFGHNISGFDFGMLINWMNKCDEKYFGSFVNYRNKFDTLSLLQNMQILGVLEELPSNKLGDVCQHYDIELENAHDALADIRASRELAYKLSKIIKRKMKG